MKIYEDVVSKKDTYIPVKTAMTCGCITKTQVRLSDLDIRARYSDLNYNRFISLKNRMKKHLFKVLTSQKRKAVERIPAFSGAVGITVFSFTTLGIIAAENRNFNFAVGGEVFLAAVLGVLTYKILKKIQ